MVRSRMRVSLRRWGRRAAKSLAEDLDFELYGMRSFHTSSSWRVLILYGRWESEEREWPGPPGLFLFIVPKSARPVEPFGTGKKRPPRTGRATRRGTTKSKKDD